MSRNILSHLKTDIFTPIFAVPDNCFKNMSFALQLISLYNFDGYYIANIDMTEQGGPYGTTVPGKIPNMPVEYTAPTIVHFEPTINDMAGLYEYNLLYY